MAGLTISQMFVTLAQIYKFYDDGMNSKPFGSDQDLEGDYLILYAPGKQFDEYTIKLLEADGWYQTTAQFDPDREWYIKL